MKVQTNNLKEKIRRIVSVAVVVAIVMTSYGVSTLASSINHVVSVKTLNANKDEDLSTKYYEEYKFVREQTLLLNTDNETSEEQVENQTPESSKESTLVNETLNDYIVVEATESDAENQTDLETKEDEEPEHDAEDIIVDDATVSDATNDTIVENEVVENNIDAISTASDVVIDVEEIFAKATESVTLTVSEDVTGERVNYVATTSALIKTLLGVDKIDTVELFQGLVDIKNEHEELVAESSEEQFISPKKAKLSNENQVLFGGVQDDLVAEATSRAAKGMDLSKYGNNYVFGAGPDTYFDGFDGIKIRFKDGRMDPMFNIEESEKFSITDEYIAYHAEDKAEKP